VQSKNTDAIQKAGRDFPQLQILVKVQEKIHNKHQKTRSQTT